jgi:hypothetical protein
MDIALRDLDALPPATDGVHEIVRIDVSDDSGDRFALTFATADGRNLRVRLPGEQLQALADVLYALAQERSWQ